jgi:hypothetical protein
MFINQDEFVINFDEVWSWMGFSRKDVAKRLLEKHFKLNDYLSESAPLLRWSALTTSQNGGQNKETILLSLDTFETLHAQTHHTVRGYFRKMNRVMMDHLKDRELHGVQKLADSHSLAIVIRELLSNDVCCTVDVAACSTWQNANIWSGLTLFSRSEAQRPRTFGYKDHIRFQTYFF